MKESVFIILRDLIHERLGIYYDDSKRDMLEDKIYPRLSDCCLDSFLDYYYLLKYDPSATGEWQQLMDSLSVPETFFWREYDQIRALVEILLPNYQAYLEEQKRLNPYSSRGYPIKIWSAACSNGEEPLTIAMALNEAGWFDKLPISIYASDASNKAIIKARNGVFRDISFRNLPANIKFKYFTQTKDGWLIDPEIHQRIRWRKANLLDKNEIEDLAQSPVIFCPNVFIYFSENSIRKTVEFFYEKMPPLGYLCISASESLLKLNTKFKLEEIGGAFIYVKNDTMGGGI